MGYYLEINCATCQKKQTFRLGQGMRDHIPETVLCEFENPEAEQVQQILSTGAAEKIWNFQRALGICAECGKLLEVPVFTAHFLNDNSTANIIRKCHCGNVPTIITEPEDQDLSCPQCNHMLEQRVTGFWD